VAHAIYYVLTDAAAFSEKAFIAASFAGFLAQHNVALYACHAPGLLPNCTTQDSCAGGILYSIRVALQGYFLRLVVLGSGILAKIGLNSRLIVLLIVAPERALCVLCIPGTVVDTGAAYI
jgi:hypothetical protein